MRYYLKLYLAAMAAFFALDMLWLGVVARGFYQKQIGYLMAAETNWIAAIAFYALFLLGVVVFVVVPGLASRSLRATLARAALFGLVTYATYDLTNLATVKDWPLWLTVVDMAWGVALTTTASAAAFLAGRRNA